MSVGSRTTIWKSSEEEEKTTQILSQDPDRAAGLADTLLDYITDELGYSAEEAIPGLIATVVVYALQTAAPGQALDEAVALMDRAEEKV